ncbi:hypothetical protein EV193_102187 [Herbihabitans rhizosphaerae]|uniref:Uncharacterized protein n=1 Tax=Herbihabitans rhizosphaerae TaxID=1872711 RepID=A0A4Q7L140_9PSEU|nr:hypothetical protein EV193_102187 [Herbihabitans rhizosphaerae]
MRGMRALLLAVLACGALVVGAGAATADSSTSDGTSSVQEFPRPGFP